MVNLLGGTMQEIIEVNGCGFNETGLQIPDGTTFEQWLSIGNGLAIVEKRAMWCMGDWWVYGNNKYGERAAQAIASDASFQTWMDAGWVAKKFETSRRHEVVPWSFHREVASLPESEADELLDKVEESYISDKKITQKELRQLVKEKKHGEIKAIAPPEGKYRTIVIDPPWDMQKISREVRPNQVGFDYPTMSVDDIKAFDICADESCHVYCWTTQKYLPKTFEILEAWGVDYIFTMTWHKPGGFQPVGLPQYNSEFVVFGRRGGLVFDETKAFNTCFNADRREHSRKPDEFYNLVRRVSPAPRIDIFSRESRAGFDQYGNQEGKFNGL